ncbi:MFS transporter [Actinomadura decatromicini]|uniref:MFS transporter n=1 Tax=Actinomadura decatromicini TaxID=2604572 RepID=A0A5D3FD44_9ACTN|nr:MFS transporter [Actinomadura decatromicini]TYK45796.1 MFS transporter [Actinomadura decatromicini]
MNTSARKWGTFAICLLVALVPNIDLTALNQAVPHLSADLHPSSTQILWIADAYGFALAGLLITMGGIGDRIGHKRLLLMGTALFAAASAVTAYAPSAELLIAARAVLGVAGATLMPSCLSLIRRAFTDGKERTMAVGAFSGVAGLAVGLGPVIGGALLDHFWWGSVFLINVPIMAVALVAGAFVLVESRNPVPGRLDLASVPLSAVGVLGLVYAIKEAAAHGPGHAQIYVSAVAGAVALAAFFVRQTRLEEPLIDVRLFRNAAFSGSIGTNMFAMFTLVAQSLIFSLYFQLALGWSPLKAGLAGLPGAAGAMVGGAVLAPPLISALGRARVVAAGMLISATGFSIYLTIGLHPSYWTVMLPSMVLAGIGMGLAMTVTADTVLASVPKARSGAASAISETATELGGALGMAVLGSVLNAVYRNVLDVPAGTPAPAASAARDSLGAALQTAARLPGTLGGQLADAARNAFVDGMHAALVCSAGLAALVAVFALVTLRNVPKVIPEAQEPEEPGLVTAP